AQEPLRACHRLMRGAPGPKPVAVLGETPIPIRLQHLQQRLLNQAVQYGRYPKWPHAAARLGYLYPPHRLRPVSAFEQPVAYLGPVPPEIVPKRFDAHAVDARTTAVPSDLSQRTKQVSPLQQALHQHPCINRSVLFRLANSGFIP